MKRSILPIMFSLMCACTQPAARTTTPSTAPSAARSESHVDSNVEALVKACQERGDINFTYTKETRDALVATPVSAEDVEHVPSADVETFAKNALERYGFECRPIGPPHLHVLLIERKTG